MKLSNENIKFNYNKNIINIIIMAVKNDGARKISRSILAVVTSLSCSFTIIFKLYNLYIVHIPPHLSPYPFITCKKTSIGIAHGYKIYSYIHCQIFVCQRQFSFHW